MKTFFNTQIRLILDYCSCVYNVGCLGNCRRLSYSSDVGLVVLRDWFDGLCRQAGGAGSVLSEGQEVEV